MHGGAVGTLLRRIHIPDTRRLLIPNGLGHPCYTPLPLPGEALADTPIWIEGPMALAGTPRERELHGGILLERHRESDVWAPGLVVARFAFISNGLPIVPGGRVLVDVDAIDDRGRIAFPEFLRMRDGIETVAEAPDSSLWAMNEYAALLRDRWYVRCLSRLSTIRLPSSFAYHAAADHGDDGLRAMLRSTAVEAPDPALVAAMDPTARAFTEGFFSNLRSRGPFLALSALRLAPIIGGHRYS